MATTSPEQVREGLLVVTQAARADAQAVAQAAQGPPAIRAALFAATPLIVADYGDGAAALALDWYEELREAASPRRPYAPRPMTTVREERLAATVAWATEPLYEIEQQIEREAAELVRAVEESLMRLEPEIQKEVAAGFRDTMTGNAAEDPDAGGWQRFARVGACKFCLMLEGRGSVYTEATVDFAAHTDCHCVVGPSFDPDAPRASVMQYIASSRNRTPEQQAALREYLNTHFPDAPG